MNCMPTTKLPRGLSALALALLALAPGCVGSKTYWPSDAELRAFEEAGPVNPEFDADYNFVTASQSGPYEVIRGDLLEVVVSQSLLDPTLQGGPVQARVADDGTITLPLIGQLNAAGRSLAALEDAVRGGLHPRFVRDRPAVIVRLHEPCRVGVSVHGAVEDPGIHELASNRLSLYGALDAAGGVSKAQNLKVGAHRIRVHRADTGQPATTTVVVPVRGLNLPQSDVQLHGGETIEVERWEPELFTVVGMVAKPGAFEYPTRGSYNLMQALAIAGGIDRVANPPYATVFRKNAEGEILPVTFKIRGDGLVRASSVSIRAGDVIAVQHTAGSWTRALLAKVLRLQVNFLVDPLDTR